MLIYFIFCRWVWPQHRQPPEGFVYNTPVQSYTFLLSKVVMQILSTFCINDKHDNIIMNFLLLPTVRHPCAIYSCVIFHNIQFTYYLFNLMLTLQVSVPFVYKTQTL